MTLNLFSAPVFFVVFRESLETGIIISVLLAFLKQTLDGDAQNRGSYKRLAKQVWIGSFSALLICCIIGAGIIGGFYASHKNKEAWSKIEYYWEGSFAIVASVMITIMGAALLRVSKMQGKWRVKLREEVDKNNIWYKRWGKKYVMFLIPFITVLREGVEAIVFVSGVSFTADPSSIGIPIVVGLIAGAAASYIIYKSGLGAKLQLFLVGSTCLLYLIAAGLFSRGVWYFQAQMWNEAVGSDAAELGAGPGSYDIDQSVWHVNFGNPELNGGGGWGIFNAILGWQNSATYGSVISYNLYWLFVIGMFGLMRYREVKGHLPFRKAKRTGKIEDDSETPSDSSSRIFDRESEAKEPGVSLAPVRPMETISD